VAKLKDMYKCDKHGELESEWCKDCGEIKECDCSVIITTRFKELIIDCSDGERTVKIYIDHCDTCGNVMCVR
jgi:primosomal protein N'